MRAPAARPHETVCQRLQVSERWSEDLWVAHREGTGGGAGRSSGGAGHGDAGVDEASRVAVEPSNQSSVPASWQFP